MSAALLWPVICVTVPGLCAAWLAGAAAWMLLHRDGAH